MQTLGKRIDYESLRILWEAGHSVIDVGKWLAEFQALALHKRVHVEKIQVTFHTLLTGTEEVHYAIRVDMTLLVEGNYPAYRSKIRKELLRELYRIQKNNVADSSFVVTSVL